MKRILIITGIVIALATGALFLVPWNDVFKDRMIAYLQNAGVQDVTFDVDAITFTHASLRHISVGRDNPLTLQSLDVRYSPREVIKGVFQDLTIQGLDIHITQQDQQWQVAGINSSAEAPDAQKTLPDLRALIERLPFSTITVTDSFIRINGQSVNAALPFTMTLTPGTAPALDLVISPSTLSAGKADIQLGTLQARLTPDEQGVWRGKWTLDRVEPGETLPFPVLSGTGTLAYDGAQIIADGTFSSADKLYEAVFSVLYNMAEKKDRRLEIVDAHFPFKEGTVTASKVIIPLGPRENITIPLRVKTVSIDALLQTLTGQRVSATGTVSGQVPVILKKDGTYSLGQGTLKADSAGIIQMDGAAIPGDNEQVSLVRNILENLNYSLLTAAVDTTGGQGIVVRLSLEGSNPGVYDGRTVKLNVNLTGDVLDFIQQNAMLITNPETLLKRELE